ncbi:hypothetical protein RB195_010463 [Necator americanus]|uniref:Peptidase metallopeptidase domain-containing protein n=1 Tax=Necator americanus TaxID=51031 RepID=A0ABR1CY47_NECAM
MIWCMATCERRLEVAQDLFENVFWSKMMTCMTHFCRNWRRKGSVAKFRCWFCYVLICPPCRYLRDLVNSSDFSSLPLSAKKNPSDTAADESKFYEELEDVIHKEKALYKSIVGDFKIKVGKARRKEYTFRRFGLVDVSWLVERKRQRDSELQALQRRRKRYVVRKKRWRHNLLTWRIDTSNIKKEDEYVVRATLHRAFQEWSAVSNVRFEEVADKSADIVIGFERGKHQDDFPFDGKDGIVAHAFYPRDGRLHFDADEDWSLNSATGTAVHEIGHLLGLEHSVDPRAVMYPAKRPYNSDFTLEDDDVRAVRILFPSEEEFKTYEKKKSPHLNEADRDRETNLPVIVENLHGGLSQEKFNNTNMEFIFPFPLPQLHQK